MYSVSVPIKSKMEELATLKIIRGQKKARITRENTFFESISKDAINEEIASTLSVRLNKLEPVWDEFCEVQGQIDILTAENSEIAQGELSERAEFESKYFYLVGVMRSTIGTFYNKKNEGPVRVVSEPSKKQNVQLPTLKLQQFDGKLESWGEFHDTFLALVHNNSELDDVLKFYYLRNALSKEAANIIKAMKATAENYKIAWQALKDRYENKGLTVQNHIRALWEQPQVQKESHKELRDLLDNTTVGLRQLESLGQKTDGWDSLIIYMLVTKFDSITRREWETLCLENKDPKMSDMTNFLNKKCQLLEKLQGKNIKNTTASSTSVINKNKKYYSNAYIVANKFACYFCKQAHSVYSCDKLLKFKPQERLIQIKNSKLCINCLRPDHSAAHCKMASCRKCNGKHNSLLHFEAQEPEFNVNVAALAENNNTSEKQQENDILNATVNAHSLNKISQVLLATAVVQARELSGNYIEIRALLDTGAQSNFCTEKLCKRLNLTRNKINHAVSGMGKNPINIEHAVNIEISSKHNSFKTDLMFLVINNITENLPSRSFNAQELNIPENIPLADPRFNISNEIDILLGCHVFWQLLRQGQLRLGDGQLTLQKTALGWVVGGNLNVNFNKNKSISCLSIDKEESKYLDEQLQKFWLVEECRKPTKQMLNDSDFFCEDHFLQTHKRDVQGRFSVRIPFRENKNLLGDSRQFALERFQSLERKLSKNNNLKIEYQNFMSEYINLGHMFEINEKEHDDLNFYLPHHAVVKESSLTTRTRVVFDASMKTTSGLSLNDIQHSGPNIQGDLFNILLRYRTHKYVFTGDVSKMYRQIELEKEDRAFQRIFWRSEPSENLKCYELATVSYGTASAAYLAIRCLHQLADENVLKFPKACNIIKTDFYMDDVLSGGDSVRDVIQLQHEIQSILASGGFELRKWLCNKPDIINEFQVNKDLDSSILHIGPNENNKTLGIYWNSTTDSIHYSINIFNTNVTKRSILSIISQIYDPLGLVGPVIIVAKLIIQKLWQAKIGWDDQVPEDIYNKWQQFKDDLVCLNELSIPRYCLNSKVISIELHGFSDASTVAYGVSLYMRYKTSSGEYNSNLLCAKSRVAPIKFITLPRLELSGALLLAQLVNRVRDVINIKFDKYFYYTDSSIALYWIKGSPENWKVFVANRVSQIQELTNVNEWYHCRSEDNPADIISRGCDVGTILKSSLWFNGPEWLQQEESNWPKNKINLKLNEVPEQRTVVNIATIQGSNNDFNIFDRFSTLSKLQRVCAYMLRFVNNCKGSSVKVIGNLTPLELQNALNILVKLSQQESFSREVERLNKGKSIGAKSSILSLNPFMDKNKIIRVGGRLQNAELNFDRTHPILISNKHRLTTLILQNEHKRLLHCGAQQLLSSIRERFWPTSGRSLCKGVIRKCLVCFRAKPITGKYLMGNLPSVRLKPSYPFSNTGVDFSGPHMIKDRTTRGAKSLKAYVCIFVCLVTKAVHLELVSNLTSDAFIAGFRRFAARRGRPSNLFSDNGRNFVGANNKLQEISDFFSSEVQNVANQLASESITWNFIPPKAPNFGGIWEAGVKSFKFHLKRVLNNTLLTYESFSTVLAQIESILNSRPLSPLSMDPNDLNPLTPSHLLIGHSLSALPDVDYMRVPENRLSMHKRNQQIIQHYWSRWYREYISELQTRVKWKQNYKQLLQTGTLVLVKEDNLPPQLWKLGRVLQVHPGSDGVVRVATLKVGNGVCKRSVTKLCVLPFDGNEKDSMTSK